MQSRISTPRTPRLGALQQFLPLVTFTFEGLQGTEWVVSGLRIAPPEDSDEPKDGALISVETERGDGDDLTAASFFEIEATDDGGLIRTQGTISELAANRWTLEFGAVSVLATAEIAGGEPGIGQRVLIWSEPGEGGDLIALYVRVLDQEPINDTLLSPPSP